MCYSFEVSLGTGIAAYALGYILFQRDLTESEKKTVIAFLIFTSMQFVDAILWFTKMKKDWVNFLVTSFVIPIILIMQVVYNIYFISETDNRLLDAIIIIGSMYIFYRFHGYSQPMCSNKLSSPIWANNDVHVLEALIFAMFITFPSWKAFLIVSLFVFAVKYYVKGAIGSWWCFMAAFLSTIMYFTFGIKGREFFLKFK
jgi:hypothetical protein